MTATEMTSKTVTQLTPNCGKKLMFVQGTSTENDDWIVVAGLSTIEGAYLRATNGTLGTATWTSNLLTITNGGVLVWSGFVWGY